MLPLVQRELRVAARQKRLYRGRLFIGTVVVLFGAGALLAANPNNPVRSGSLFGFFSFLALLLCLLEGPRKTAGSISEEKRAGTLGFLFLTDLHGWDIVLGKFTGALIRSLNALLAFFPVLAVTLLAGGTTLGDFWRTVLVLLVVVCFSLSGSLLLSALARDRTLSVAAALLIALCILPWIAKWVIADGFGLAEWRWVMMLSPVALLLHAWESYYLLGAQWYWPALGGFAAASALCLVLAGLVLPHTWQERPRRAFVKKSVRKARADAKRRTRQLDRNPILWVSYNAGQARGFRIIFYTLGVVLLASRFFAADIGVPPHVMDVIALVVLTLLLNVYIASQASINLAEAKASGALEMLLSTPVKVADIIRGQILALKEMFLVPALVLTAWFGLGVFQYTWRNGATGAVVLLLLYLQFALAICTTAAVGMWMGMSSKTPNRALFKTLLFALFLPYVVNMIMCVPAFIVQLVLTAIAREQVIKKFRRYVAERYLQAPGFVLAPVPAAGPNAPPVLRPPAPR